MVRRTSTPAFQGRPSSGFNNVGEVDYKEGGATIEEGLAPRFHYEQRSFSKHVEPVQDSFLL